MVRILFPPPASQSVTISAAPATGTGSHGWQKGRRWSVYGWSKLPERVRAAASAGRRARDALAHVSTDPSGRGRLRIRSSISSRIAFSLRASRLAFALRLTTNLPFLVLLHARWTILSSGAAMPSGRCRPSGFGCNAGVTAAPVCGSRTGLPPGGPIHRYNCFRDIFAILSGSGGLLDMNALCRKSVNNVVRTAPLEFRIVSCRGDLNLQW